MCIRDSKYCKSKYVDDYGVSSSEACASVCGECGSTTEDSTSWYFKKSKNTCGDYVAEDPDKFCKSKYVDNYGIKAKEACPVTCG